MVTLNVVKGEVPVKLPGNKMVLADFTIESDGYISISFKDEPLATAIFRQAVNQRLIALDLAYTFN